MTERIPLDAPLPQGRKRSPLAKATELARQQTTVINYVVEVKAHGKTWITWPDGRTPTPDEAFARDSYDNVLLSVQSTGNDLAVRLVKRTAQITDEVLEETL